MSKKILFHGNWTLLNTGFGGVKKRVMRWFFKRGFTCVEAINGMEWDAPETKRLPWKAYGLNPSKEQQAQIASIQDNGQRDAAHKAASYGLYRLGEVVKLEKPDILISLEDSWGFGDLFDKEWFKKLNPYLWCTIDSTPLLGSQLELGLKTKNLLVWAPFAERLYKEKGYSHVRTLAGCIDPEEFKPLSQERRLELRKKFGLENSFVAMFLSRNQLRKSFPNLLDGFKIFKEKYPDSNAKMLFHTSYGEGWPIPNLIKERDIDNNDILTTYFCKSCRQYEIRPFCGQPIDCPICGAKNSFETSNIVHGLHEEQLSEVYGVSDIYTHAFTSGGWEAGNWQAKMCGKIVATTNYSCGENACTEESAGIPLEWEGYMEPGTQFVKATTLPRSICDAMEKVYLMSPAEKNSWEKKARQYALNNCSTDAVCEKLEEMFLNHPNVELLDEDFEDKLKNHTFLPPNGLSPEQFIITLMQGMMHDVGDNNSTAVQEWASHLRKSNDYQGVYNHFQNIALQFNANLNNKPIDLSDLLDKDDEGKRLAIVIPESAGDIIIINSLLKKFKALYPDQNIYFFTRPEFFPLIENHPSIYRLLEYSPVLENMFFMTGNNEHAGYFNFVFYPHSLTQKTMSYQNGNTEARAEWLS